MFLSGSIPLILSFECCSVVQMSNVTVKVASSSRESELLRVRIDITAEVVATCVHE